MCFLGFEGAGEGQASEQAAAALLDAAPAMAGAADRGADADDSRQARHANDRRPWLL